MSRIFEYTQCLYSGTENRKLEVPDDSIVYLVGDEDGAEGFRFHVLIRTSEKVNADRCFLIGDHWFTFLYSIKLSECDLPCKPITECEPPKDCYIVFQQKNLFRWENINALAESCKDENGEIDWERVKKEYQMGTTGISKIRKFTARGIETVHISIKDMVGQEHRFVELFTWKYDHTWGCTFPSTFGNFFTTEEKYKQLFNDKLEEYYKLFRE